MTKLSKQQIGKCGELLVQLELLKRGVESAPMTTDSGIDLVAFSARKRDALTVQVKANERPKPGGGTGKLALDWWVPVDSPADLVAFVDLASSRIWLMTQRELAACAQQQSSGRYHFFMSVDPGYRPKKERLSRDTDFERFLLERRVASLF
jgi:hypothetical protein